MSHIPYHQRPEYLAVRDMKPKDSTRQRECGTCTLCCRLLPVNELGKLANQKCEHQCSKGCRIYKDRPGDCWAWSCRWLLGGEVGRRPDRSHVIIDDMMIDGAAITIDGVRQAIPAIQVWVDPDFPDAHEDLDVRAYLAVATLRRGAIVVVRYNSSKGFTLIPPWSNPERKWVRMESNVLPENDPRTIADREALGLPNI